MRNAIVIDELVITSDNSGAIGQKDLDVVQVPDDVTSYYSARVTLLEQLAAGALPHTIIMLNFSSVEAWPRYIVGIERLFSELSLPLPTIQGSTESNIPTLQSAIGLTMIGRRVFKKTAYDFVDLQWYSYGIPLVGQQLLEHVDASASIKTIIAALQDDIIEQIIPVGSKGIKYEIKQLLDVNLEQGDLPFNIDASAGPSTVVILGLKKQSATLIEQQFPAYLHRLI